MKKKYISIISAIFMSISIVGCSNNNSEETIKYQDVKFVEDVEKAFVSRNNYVEKVANDKISVDNNLDYFTECVEKELSILSKYKDGVFSDVQIRKLANEYIKGLEMQKNSLKYYNNDYSKYEIEWGAGYDIRCTALIELVDNYGVNIEEERIRDLRTNAQVVKEEAEFERKIEEMLKDVKFEKTKDEYGLKYYSAIVENTSGKSFANFDFNIKLLDSDGVVIENQWAYATNWALNEKVKFEFMTMSKFHSLEWEYSYIEK